MASGEPALRPSDADLKHNTRRIISLLVDSPSCLLVFLSHPLSCSSHTRHVDSKPSIEPSTMHFSITTALAFALVGSALANPGVSPASVSQNADPGSSFSVDKVVTTAKIPPNPDVVLLVDVTGSMF